MKTAPLPHNPIRVGFAAVLDDDAPNALIPEWLDENTVLVGYHPGLLTRAGAAYVMRLILGRDFLDIDRTEPTGAGA